MGHFRWNSTGNSASKIILFIIFINNEDRRENVCKNLRLNQTGKGTRTCENRIRSQNNLEKWLEIKKVKFSTQEYKRTPVGKNHSSSNKIWTTWLGYSQCQSKKNKELIITHLYDAVEKKKLETKPKMAQTKNNKNKSTKPFARPNIQNLLNYFR